MLLTVALMPLPGPLICLYLHFVLVVYSMVFLGYNFSFNLYFDCSQNQRVAALYFDSYEEKIRVAEL